MDILATHYMYIGGQLLYWDWDVLFWGAVTIMGLGFIVGRSAKSVDFQLITSQSVLDCIRYNIMINGICTDSRQDCSQQGAP